MHWVTGGCIPRRACRQGLWGKNEEEMVVGGGNVLPCQSCHFEPSVMEDSAAPCRNGNGSTERVTPYSWVHSAGIAELRQVCFLMVEGCLPACLSWAPLAPLALEAPCRSGRMFSDLHNPPASLVAPFLFSLNCRDGIQPHA